MPKNIVVCSDGTGNIALKNRGTNVFKLFEAVDLNGHRFDPSLTPQVALYDDGVGTESFKPLKLLGGAFGAGLGRNVRQLYKELARVYDPGDQIFLFGFSRGAFTVRTLAGLISTCGLLDPSNIATAGALDEAVNREYAAYRRCYRPVLFELVLGEPTRPDPNAERRGYRMQPDVRIRFVGVWDTVEAVGLPFHLGDLVNTVITRFKFPNHRLSGIVDQACQALSIDDERESFFPLLWDEADEAPGRIEQVWFPGAHSNVGGGYPKQGMSLVPLDWMMTKARLADLRFIEADEVQYHDHANVDDKLYDPRAGLGVFYRWKPRNIARLCADRGIEKPLVHMSTLERAAHGTEDYAPGNLPASSVVVVTLQRDPEKAALLAARAAMLEVALGETNPNLLPSVRGPIAIGLASYYLYLATCIMTVVATALSGDLGRLRHPMLAAKSIAMLIYAVIAGRWDDVFVAFRAMASHWALVIALAAGFLVSLALSTFADRRMSAKFSDFWHRLQPNLRAALKAARAVMADSPGR